MRPLARAVFALSTALVAVGCSGAARPGTATEPDPYAGDPELARAVTRALDTALAPGPSADGARADLRIVSECFLEDALYRVEVFGNGVGVWNRERQFRLADARVTELLELLRSAGFGSMREVYGEAEAEVPIPQDAPPPGGGGELTATRVLCLVSLRIGEVEKQSLQISKPPRSEELAALAGSIFDLCRDAAADGVSAADLNDGLSKIAAGTLAPQTLSVILHRKPEPRELGAGVPGFLLRIDGGRATVSRLEGSGAYGPERRLDLGDEEIAALAADLAKARIGDVPVNLWAEHYTDLMIGVLDHELRLQARRFARMTPRTHGEAQERYDRVYRELDALARRPEG